MTKRLFFVLSLAWLVLPQTADADMTLTIKPVGDDLLFRLRGTIDTSVFSIGPLTIGGRPGNSFTHGYSAVSGTGGLSGISADSTISSSTSQVDLYFFSDDKALMPFGELPARIGSQRFTVSPPFWFGYRDGTQSSGLPGHLKDAILLPYQYDSGSFVDLLFTQPNTDLSRYYIEQGYYWGVTFADGTGSRQSVTFHVVPEPTTDALALTAVCLAIGRWRRKSAQA